MQIASLGFASSTCTLCSIHTCTHDPHNPRNSIPFEQKWTNNTISWTYRSYVLNNLFGMNKCSYQYLWDNKFHARMDAGCMGPDLKYTLCVTFLSFIFNSVLYLYDVFCCFFFFTYDVAKYLYFPSLFYDDFSTLAFSFLLGYFAFMLKNDLVRLPMRQVSTRYYIILHRN